jgi:hypothetical protein
MSYSQIGNFERGIYDCCAYKQRLSLSQKEFEYEMYNGMYENINKDNCVDENIKKRIVNKNNIKLIDVESNILNIIQPLSKCDIYKYNPNKPCRNCISTYDKNLPIYANNLCSIVSNNIKKQKTSGYTLPNQNICSNDTINKNIMNVFLNSSSNQPLYDGSYEKKINYDTNAINLTTFMPMSDYSDYGNA